MSHSARQVLKVARARLAASMNLNKWAKGKQLTNRLVFAGGDPLFRGLPKIVKWGPNISLYWLGTELVWLGKGGPHD